MNVAKLGGLVSVLSATLLHIRQKGGQGQFGLVEYKMVHILKLLVFAGEERPAGYDLEIRLLTAGDDFAC